MRALHTLGEDTRKPNRLTLTPEKLLTPDALVEAGDAEEALEDGEASEAGVEVDHWVCSEASNQS